MRQKTIGETPSQLQKQSYFETIAGESSTAVGLRLGRIALADIQGINGTLEFQHGGLVAWFTRLPGQITFCDGTGILFREDPVEGYVIDLLQP